MAATFVFLAEENSLSFLSLTEEEMVIAVSSFSGFGAGMVGNSLNAMVATRVQVVVDLYRCIATPEPGFYEHPMQFDAGNGARFMEAGAVAGNVTIVTACFLLYFFADYFMKRPLFIPLPRLFARAGWLLYIILTQATISFCCRMFKHASTGGELAAAVIVFLYWLALLVFAFYCVFDLKVRWLPFGAGAPTEELVKIYPELAPLPAGAKADSAVPLPGLPAAPSARAALGDKDANLLGDEELTSADPHRPSAVAAGAADSSGAAAAAASAVAAPAKLKTPILGMKSKINDFVLKSVLKSEEAFKVGYGADGTMPTAAAEGRRAKRRAYIAKSREGKVYVNRPLLPGERRAGKWVELYEDSKDKLRYGALFMGLRPGWSYFLLFQLGMSWIYGILQGAKNPMSPNRCEAESWVATILLIIEAVTYASLQPSRFFNDNLVFDFITAGNMAAGAMLASRRSSGYSEILVYVAVLIVTGMMVLKMVLDVYTRISAKMNKDSLLSAEADLQAQRGELNRGDAARAVMEKKKALDAKNNTNGAAGGDDGGREADALGTKAIGGGRNVFASSSNNGQGDGSGAASGGVGGPIGQNELKLEFGSGRVLQRQSSASPEDDDQYHRHGARIQITDNYSPAHASSSSSPYGQQQQQQRPNQHLISPAVRGFLSLSPEGSPDRSTAKRKNQLSVAHHDDDDNDDREDTVPYQRVRLGANGLVEGLTLFDTAPALPLRLSPGPANRNMFAAATTATPGASPSPSDASPSGRFGPLFQSTDNHHHDSHHLSQLRASRDEPVRNFNPLLQEQDDAGEQGRKKKSSSIEEELGLGGGGSEDEASPRTAANRQSIADMQSALESNRQLGGTGNRGADIMTAGSSSSSSSRKNNVSSYSLTTSLTGAFSVPPLPLLSSISQAESGTNNNKNIFKKLQQADGPRQQQQQQPQNHFQDPEAPTFPPPFSTGNAGARTFAPFAGLNGGKDNSNNKKLLASPSPSSSSDALGPLRANTAAVLGSPPPKTTSAAAAASKNGSAGENETRPLFSGYFAPKDQDITPLPAKQNPNNSSSSNNNQSSALLQQATTAHSMRPLLTQFSVAHLPNAIYKAAAPMPMDDAVAEKLLQHNNPFAQHVWQEDQRQMKVLPMLPRPTDATASSATMMATQEDDYDAPPSRPNPAARPAPTFARIDEL